MVVPGARVPVDEVDARGAADDGVAFFVAEAPERGGFAFDAAGGFRRARGARLHADVDAFGFAHDGARGAGGEQAARRARRAARGARTGRYGGCVRRRGPACGRSWSRGPHRQRRADALAPLDPPRAGIGRARPAALARPGYRDAAPRPIRPSWPRASSPATARPGARRSAWLAAALLIAALGTFAALIGARAVLARRRGARQARLPPDRRGHHLEAQARDPARGRPRRQRERLRRGKPGRERRRIRPLGGNGARDAALSGAAEHRSDRARAGLLAARLRSTACAPPRRSRSARAEAARRCPSPSSPRAGAPSTASPSRASRAAARATCPRGSTTARSSARSTARVSRERPATRRSASPARRRSACRRPSTGAASSPPPRGPPSAPSSAGSASASSPSVLLSTALAGRTDTAVTFTLRRGRLRHRLPQRPRARRRGDRDERPAQRLDGAHRRGRAAARHRRGLPRAHAADRRLAAQRAARACSLFLLGTGRTLRARAGPREDRRALAPRSARRPHRAAQPRARARPRGADARAHRAPARR